MSDDLQEFQQLYLGQFWDSDLNIQLHQLAAHYIQETEAFDQLVCLHRNERGIAIPIDLWERQQCGAHAHEMARDYEWIAYKLGFTHADWLSARNRADREMSDFS